MPTPNLDTDNARLVVTVAHEPEYIAGFPMMVVLTVTPASGVGKVAVSPETVGSHWMTTMRITDVATGEVKVESVRKKRVFGADPFLLAEGAKAAFLVDLYQDLPASGLPPGRYSVRLQYAGVEAPPFEVAFRAPTVAEASRIAALQHEIALWTPFIDWSDWVLRPIRFAENVAPPTSHADPLRYFILLRYLNQGPVEPENIPPSLFDLLDGMYAPFGAALRLDVASAKGRGIRSDRASVRAAYPEIEIGGYRTSSAPSSARSRWSAPT
ncbi:MAG: hypothetical protein U0414_20065 [Polyangiaceae bacterium]